MCTISRRFRVSYVKYSVWLFIFGSWQRPQNWRQWHLTFILKKAVTRMRSNEAEILSQQGLNQLAEGSAAEAVGSFRAAIAIDSDFYEAHHGLIRALRDAGRLEQSIAAALALTALTPNDPLAHTTLSISLQQAGHVPEAEAAAARARILEWKAELQSSRDGDVAP
jgi:Flp pilus assembly protein TadD